MRSWLFDVQDVERHDWWSGRTGNTDRFASVLYLLASLLPLLWFVATGHSSEWLKTTSGSTRVLLLAYGALVSVLPHVWLWLEASAFFAWSAQKYREEAPRKEQRDRFKLHADGAKALWTSVIALYAGALLKF